MLVFGHCLISGISRILAALLIVWPFASISADSPYTGPEVTAVLTFFKDGETSDFRGLTLGDPKKWTSLVDKLTGESAGGKVKMKPADFRGKGNAMRVTWGEELDMGQVAIYGPPVDLTYYGESLALVFEVLVHHAPNLDVQLGMDCRFPCAASFDIGAALKALKRESWRTISAPLSCLKSDNFDLAKINGVFIMKTAGSMDISLADIRLEKVTKLSLRCPRV